MFFLALSHSCSTCPLHPIICMLTFSWLLMSDRGASFWLWFKGHILGKSAVSLKVYVSKCHIDGRKICFSYIYTSKHLQCAIKGCLLVILLLRLFKWWLLSAYSVSLLFTFSGLCLVHIMHWFVLELSCKERGKLNPEVVLLSESSSQRVYERTPPRLLCSAVLPLGRLSSLFLFLFYPLLLAVTEDGGRNVGYSVLWRSQGSPLV